MRISRLELKNFKRFTDLTIGEIPIGAKLVLLIGSNGSGKSSVFDAFEALNKMKRGDLAERTYYSKKIEFEFEVRLQTEDSYFLLEKGAVRSQNKSLDALNFYGRSSFRQVPRLTRTSLGTSNINLEYDTDRPKYFIDRDERFENDIEHITGIILRDIFRTPDAQSKIKERFIDPINRALNNVFGQKENTRLELIEIIPPLEGKTSQVTFKKGNTEFHYDQLSAGEKEVINILMNLTSRRSALENAICFFDEIDLHLNTQIQYRLIQEIVDNWIPENSQFWTASHSLGFIEFAKNSQNAVIIDFDDLDFDQAQTLTPVPSDDANVYEIAVGKDFLPSLLAGKTLCFVENNDVDYYAQVNLPDKLFARATNRNTVYHKVLSERSYQGIVDRDFLSDEDIDLIRAQYPNLYILPYYSIENLLFHPENLAEYYASRHSIFDLDEYIQRLRAAKNAIRETLILKIISNRTDYPYFGEQQFSNSSRQNRFKKKGENDDEAGKIAAYLNSADFETWYKVFPMKTYATDVPQRQNISKIELARTDWFNARVKNIFGSR